MGPFEELEKMTAAAEGSICDDEFIEKYNKDVAKQYYSDEKLDVLSASTGLDRAACEKLLAGKQKLLSPSAKSHISDTEARRMYVLLMSGPLSTPESIQTAGGLKTPPECFPGEGDAGDVPFCKVDGKARLTILQWISMNAADFKPTFTRVFLRAEKNFNTFSIYPTLGVDSTLPQFRARDTPVEPSVDQYPVWYFFYGTLASTHILANKMGISGDVTPELFSATVKGGRIGTWGGKYKALVDAPPNSVVKGKAYQVMSEENEDALRIYETDQYEVVRCRICIGDEVTRREVNGCTFRFVGSLD